MAVLLDNYGVESDWIEIHNRTAAPINLNGYYLTDDRRRFDEVAVPERLDCCHGYLVVFASNQDDRDPLQPLTHEFRAQQRGRIPRAHRAGRPDGRPRVRARVSAAAGKYLLRHRPDLERSELRVARCGGQDHRAHRGNHATTNPCGIRQRTRRTPTGSAARRASASARRSTVSWCANIRPTSRPAARSATTLDNDRGSADR